jgi:hypothetical protein
VTSKKIGLDMSVFVHKYKVVSFGQSLCVIFCKIIILMCRSCFVCQLNHPEYKLSHPAGQCSSSIRFRLGRPHLFFVQYLLYLF